MNDIEKKLSEVEKPEFSNNKHKHQLRRALLSSSQFEKKKSIWPKVAFSLSAATAVAAIVLAVVVYAPGPETSFSPDFVQLGDSDNPMPQGNEGLLADGGIRKFRSDQELQEFIAKNKIKKEGESPEYSMETGSSSIARGEGLGGGSSTDYSTTNVQVEGVDEADVVKNDGQYIYAVSNDKVSILEAYPAKEMKKLSEIVIPADEENNYRPEAQLYLNDNNLIIITSEYSKVLSGNEDSSRCDLIDMCPQTYYEEEAIVYIYDISDRSNPKMRDKISSSGYYVNSRMVGDYVYIVTNQALSHGIILPSIENNGQEEVVRSQDIAYNSDVKDNNFRFTSVIAIDIVDGETTQQVSLAGDSQEIYVSTGNIYTTQTNYAYLNENKVLAEAEESQEKTIINRISIDKDKVEYAATGEVRGWLLNQFSMDEYDKKFRIATTVEEFNGNELSYSDNNVYILDENLERVGALEGLAQGERIYSVRFMGERGYIVTYKEVDPLFVIDLKNPKNPYVLGQLKIPGYSDYLHPYDENHLIGIGKDTEVVTSNIEGEENIVLPKGMKMAIFDVSDVTKPKELHKVVIGDVGTSSEALYDHKAFLFNKKNGLLVLPISLAEIPEGVEDDRSYGENVFQGVFVYRVDLNKGFDLKGRVTHYSAEQVEQAEFHNYTQTIRRSLYMDDVLYTLSQEFIKANQLWSLKEIKADKL